MLFFICTLQDGELTHSESPQLRPEPPETPSLKSKGVYKDSLGGMDRLDMDTCAWKELRRLEPDSRGSETLGERG